MAPLKITAIPVRTNENQRQKFERTLSVSKNNDDKKEDKKDDEEAASILSILKMLQEDQVKNEETRKRMA